MKNILTIAFFVLLMSAVNAQNVGVSETIIVPEPSAIMELRSSARGFLITRMTTLQRDAIASPAQSLMIFNTTTKCLEIWVDAWYPIWCYSDTSTTYSCGDLVPYNGYSYSTVQIGNQCWFAENLRTTQYNDSSPVPIKTTSADWFLPTPGYCWYNNDQTTYGVHGCIYNWYALDSLSNGGKKICPDGWSVPDESDWDELRSYLANNGYNCVPGGGGGNIYWFTKSLSSTSLWSISANECTPGYDQVSNNSTGFNAFPAGYRAPNGTFANFTTTANFWSRDEASSTGAYSRGLMYSTTLWVNWSVNKMEGRNIRCMKD